MEILHHIEKAYSFINQGKVIAYPTEAVLGLGCNPFNQEAVNKLLQLKKRPAAKGLILLIADWSQLKPLVAEVSEALLAQVKSTWPGPVTWVFPKSKTIPFWISGDHSTIAIRMSAHPVAHALCKYGPVVSTSANVSNFPPARDLNQLKSQFPQGIDAFLAGELGAENQPSAIYDLVSGRQLR